MDFDLSKLTSDQSKASETKAKPRFGPAARAVSVASGEVYAFGVCDRYSRQLWFRDQSRKQSPLKSQLLPMKAQKHSHKVCV